MIHSITLNPGSDTLGVYVTNSTSQEPGRQLFVTEYLKFVLM